MRTTVCLYVKKTQVICLIYIHTRCQINTKYTLMNELQRMSKELAMTALDAYCRYEPEGTEGNQGTVGYPA
jgi:hypothetical protein